MCSFPSYARQGEKTRQEILNDIIAKSKERKLEKARGKEEQESERERLDEGMEELLGFLHQRPTKKDEASATRGQSDDYDLTMRVRAISWGFLLLARWDSISCVCCDPVTARTSSYPRPGCRRDYFPRFFPPFV